MKNGNLLLERMLGRPAVPSHSNGFIWTKSRHPRTSDAMASLRKNARPKKKSKTARGEFADHWV